MKVKMRNLYLTEGYLSKAEYPYFGFISTVKSFSTPSCSFLKRASNSFSFVFSSNSSSLSLKAAILLKTSIASSVLFLEKYIRAEFSRTKKYIIPHVIAIIFWSQKMKRHLPKITYKGVYIIGQKLYPAFIIPAKRDLLSDYQAPLRRGFFLSVIPAEPALSAVKGCRGRLTQFFSHCHPGLSS